MTHALATGFRIVAVVLGTLAASLQADDVPPFEQFHVYTAGQDNVHTYRIPAFLVTSKGTFLVFCEARKMSTRDVSPTDLVVKRSTDLGRVWSPLQTLVRGEGDDAMMNPCPVIDRATGKILLLLNNAKRRDVGRYLLVESSDDGVTWSEPRDIGIHITPHIDSFVFGPGIGIQMRSGRFVIPGYAGKWDGDHLSESYSRVLVSDDAGSSWSVGQPVSERGNESQVVELTDERLLLNWRNTTETRCRGTAISADGGMTWSKTVYDRALNECPCQASLIRYSGLASDGRSRILFSNPDSSGPRASIPARKHLTVRMSHDEGKTWPVKKLVSSGPSAYSGLAVLPDGRIGLVWEGGDAIYREGIRFARFTLEWLTDGTDR